MGGGGGCNAGSSKEKGKKKQLKAVGEIHEFLQIDRLSPKRKKKSIGCIRSTRHLMGELQGIH